MTSLFRSTTTYDPIKALLNAPTEEERDELTQRWKDSKLEELNFVGIVAALLAGVLTSTGSWPAVLANGTRQPWTVRACWYCGILFALGSVLAAAQQSIRLHRLSCSKHANTNIRRLLRKNRSDGDQRVLPRRTQVYIWQLSIHLLVLAVLTMLAGMFILIWSSTGGPTVTIGEKDWWNNEAKLAVTFSVIGLGVGCLFLWEQIELYTWRGADDTGQC